MFVKFRRYELSNGDISLRAEVVENYRDKLTGKVRQRRMGYLASIRSSLAKFPRVRTVFWQQVEKKLSGLPLSEADAQKVRAAIEKRIPRVASLPPHRKSAEPLAASVPNQPPSSPAAEAPEQSPRELLSVLASKLGLKL